MDGIVKGFKSLIGDVEMAPYSVVSTNENYEERLYPASKWVCTSLESTERDSVSSAMVRTLFNYISGKNNPNIRMDMTAPVTTYIEPGSTQSVNKFTTAFYLPQEYQNDPPDAADQTVFIEKRPEMRILTRRFGGFANEESIAKEVSELAEILRKAGEEVVHFDRYYVVGYDPPYKPINRRNEIWFVKKTPLQNEAQIDGDTATDDKLI